LYWTDVVIDRGLLPDRAIRSAIRRKLAAKLDEEAARGSDGLDEHLRAMDAGPIARVPERANEQHYEVPADFYEVVLGPRRKYSSCYFGSAEMSLAAAEVEALARTCANADLQDGQAILELGCGWGALTLWMAEQYPAARITAVSNSASQRAYIEAAAKERGFGNVRVITADMNTFETDAIFDRVVSVEMFEHMCNWHALLRRIEGWMPPNGTLLMHFFCHRTHAYFYRSEGRANWMGRHFFSGGMMPSAELPARVGGPLELGEQWIWNGRHYGRTLRAWLERLDASKEPARAALEPVYGFDGAVRWIRRWRVFFMACEELFAYEDGREWFVVQQRLLKRG